jgi:hypothetical protein
MVRSSGYRRPAGRGEPDYVRCRAPRFANAPAEAIAPPPQRGDTMITVTPVAL